jgi:hypothetical protein
MGDNIDALDLLSHKAKEFSADNAQKIQRLKQKMTTSNNKGLKRFKCMLNSFMGGILFFLFWRALELV